MIDPIEKTTILMALTCYDNAFTQVKNDLDCPNVHVQYVYRAKQIERWTQECFDFCRQGEIGKTQPLSVPAMLNIENFIQKFSLAWTKLALQVMPQFLRESLIVRSAIVLDAAETFLYDLSAYAPSTRGKKCFRWLRHHSTALVDGSLRTITKEQAAAVYEHGTLLYLQLADFLKPENR